MPGSNSVIRRYTPPTCTLEISAQSSPLSRWMGQTVLNQVRFELHFDDPALPEELKVPIHGDRDQLEALCNAVTNYVQQLLHKSADSFCFTSFKSQPSSTTSEQPELKDITPASSPSSKIPNPSSMGILEATIYLESSDNLTHKLYLGSLANPTSGTIIQLTLLQLFDLATALDEYSADVITLPNLKRESSISSLPSWTPIAAMLALAVGLTPLTWQYANSIKQNQQQTAKNPTSTTENAALESSPPLNLTTPQPGVTPPGSSDIMPLPNLDPPPPPVDPSLVKTPLSFPNSTVPDTSGTSQENALTIPQTTKPIIPSNLQIPSTTPSSQQNSTGVISQSGIPFGTGQNLPSGNTSNISSIPDSIITLPDQIPSQIPPKITSQPESQQLNRGATSATKTPAIASDDDLVAKLRATRNAPFPTEVATEENKLFDIPQSAEAREYLQKNWRPPAGFSQTLEYSLMLGVDGSIERILPLNRAAREYIDNTGMPQIGKPFVSTNKAGQNLKLRVVFSPDGKVQTFPETP
ncbi:DUF4335 domain-containing protein [Anabaena sphaerica FACHB-251]|uniref:DUF4335 domain-containing protein n=1 Tax=Anabaena sphaerica FACHB-251 TaxID=2692883 RepID=A0A926WM79_9NOST|nr:DUF4335 domain-containing protein [Anabaena sphaerica]MBD2296324.1 DUF4335 domain-containing protein [Anabaena sphaerica FACHB-251]